jgi:atlastin
MSEESGFVLNELKLDFVLAKVPAGMPVAVVSVVGTFRTGKSFLLDLFLRFLRHGAASSSSAAAPEAEPAGASAHAEWLRFEGARLEGNAASGAADFARRDAPPQRRAGFKWRAGNERQTTGMWLWSEPFVRARADGSRVAVLLMDTQGLFDSKVAQMLTTQIFGLSTLLASYQIFNINQRLTENELQNVAVFAEFARIAAAVDGGGGGGEGGAGGEAHGAGGEGGEARGAAAPASGGARADKRGVDRRAGLALLVKPAPPGGAPPPPPPPPPPPVFQRLEFLIRDSVISSMRSGDAAAIDAEMLAYITGIFANAAHEDLRVVREQILTVFERTSCFLLPHPGHVVTEDARFDGGIDEIRPEFLRLLDRYVRVVFGEQLDAKRACGRPLTAPEYGAFVRAYARAFSDGKRFPEARVLFDATTEANNRAAGDAALSLFHKALAEATAHGTAHVDDAALRAALDGAQAAAAELFSSLASFGPLPAIRRARADFEANVAELSRDALARNASLGEPARVKTISVFAAASLAALWALRVFLDVFCAPFLDVCKRASTSVSALWMAIFVFAAYTLYSAGGASSALGKNLLDAAIGGTGLGETVTAAVMAASSKNASRDASREVSREPTPVPFSRDSDRPLPAAVDANPGLRRRREL